MKILVDLRPALDGHSGIPQDTRMLFGGLAHHPAVSPVGLLQSGNLVLDAGLQLDAQGKISSGLDPTQSIDILSKAVVSLQQGPVWHRVIAARRRLMAIAGPTGAGLAALLSMSTRLTGFDPTHFHDFLWRSVFAKSLPVGDFAAVMACQYRLFRWPWSRLNQLGVVTGSLGHAVFPRLRTYGLDGFVAQTPYPGRVTRGTRLIVRYHDAMPLLMPHTVRNRGFHRAMHFHALVRNARDGAWFACDSDATRSDLLSFMPQLEDRSATIPAMVSHHYTAQAEGPARVTDVIRSRRNRDAPAGGGVDGAEPVEADGAPGYLLMVSTIEPRKNHEAVLDAWEQMRAQGHPDLQLVLVGSLGWDGEPILRRLTPWLERGGVHMLAGVPPQDLRLLYRHALMTICPSFSEGFDLTGAEAMASGGLVAASDIRVHRDVYGQAAEYFNPYAPADLVQVLDRVIRSWSAQQRLERAQTGLQVASQYKSDVVIPQWFAFLEKACGRSA